MGEKREERRRAASRAKKYRAHAAENLSLADSALIPEVRDRHRYLRMAEKDELASAGEASQYPAVWRC